MKIGMIGLGKMGGNMVKRLLRKNNEVIVFDLNKDFVEEAVKNGALGSDSIENLLEKLDDKKIIWTMVPAGEATDKVINLLSEKLNKGDIVIDGGNSLYKDSVLRAEKLRKKDIFFLDAGTSGGVWGLTEGYCLMVGGEKEAFKTVEPIIKDLAPENGYAHVGPSGAGHFVKMIHNGIEYGMMQAYAEGFEILKSKDEYNLDLEQISNMWNYGSVIRSWLLELSVNIFKEDPNLEKIKGYVQDSGEGRWTVQEAIDQSVSAPVITLSLLQRFRSRKEETYSDKVLAALRNQFGGHAVKNKK